jgi:hypothetical protein
MYAAVSAVTTMHSGAWDRRNRGFLAVLSGMRLDLSDEEAAALLSLLNRAIDNDRYTLSPRVRRWREIRAKFS